MEEFKRISRDLVAKGAIIDYYQDTMQIPNGNIAKWDVIDHKGAAAVVAVREDGKLLMVRQYRNALERETLEIPAGGLNGREEPTDQAAMPSAAGTAETQSRSSHCADAPAVLPANARLLLHRAGIRHRTGCPTDPECA